MCLVTPAEGSFCSIWPFVIRAEENLNFNGYNSNLDPSHFSRSQWEMKISRLCSSSTSSRWWYQSASLSRDQCLSITVLSHPHSRIAQGMYVCMKTSYSYKWVGSSIQKRLTLFTVIIIAVKVAQCSFVRVFRHIYKMYFLIYKMYCLYFLPFCQSYSPSVGYLQPPSSEQYQITQSPSPCNPQQLQQQYSGMTSVSRGFKVVISKTFCDHEMPRVYCSSVKSNLQLSFTKSDERYWGNISDSGTQGLHVEPRCS